MYRYLILLSLLLPSYAQVGRVVNANYLNGRRVSALSPTDGNVMCWSGANSWWAPCNPTIGSFGTQTAHYVLAGPTTGSPATPTFRALVAGDIPSLSYESVLTFSSPLIRTTNTISCQVASGSLSGCLSSTDWTTFNGKQSALGYTPLNAASNLSDVASASTSRTNLGLGTASTQSTSAFEVPLTFTAPLIRTTNTITLDMWGSGSKPVAASSLGTSGNCVQWGATGLTDTGSPCGSGGTGANSLGTYLVQTSTNAPTNAQVMASLSTGLVKNTTSTGVQSIATAGTDYSAPGTAETTSANRTFTGIVDASGASRTSPTKVGTSLPGTCTVGDLFFKSNVTAGQNIYECQSTNTWTQQLNSGGGGVTAAQVNLTPVAYASLPAAATDGRIQIFTDSPYPFARDNGSSWDLFLPSGGTATDPVTVGTYSWMNQGSTTLDTTHGGITFTNPTTESAFNIHARVFNAPSTPYHVEMAYRLVQSASTNSTAGLCFSDGTKFFIFGAYQMNDEYVGFYTTNATTFGGGFQITDTSHSVRHDIIWIRMGDDGTTNLTWDTSVDGKNWVQLGSESRTAQLTPTKVGFFIDGGPTQMQVLSIKLTS